MTPEELQEQKRSLYCVWGGGTVCVVLGGFFCMFVWVFCFVLFRVFFSTFVCFFHREKIALKNIWSKHF